MIAVTVASINAANAKIAYQFFLSKGLSPAQSAGIVGNLQAESGINPHSVNSTGCTGIAQWCKGRKTDMVASGAYNPSGDPNADLLKQLDYIWAEMNGPEKRTLTLIKGATSPEQAAQIFEAAFERSGGALLPQRQSYAKEVFTTALNNAWDTVTDFDIGNAQTVGLTWKDLVPGLPLFEDLKGPVSAAVGATTILAKVYSVIGTRTFWIRAGEILLGGMMLLVGLYFMASETSAGKAAIGAGTKAATTAAVL